jgi:phospholipid/cholesterol/gamma-HCH transport system permease protein
MSEKSARQASISTENQTGGLTIIKIGGSWRIDQPLPSLNFKGDQVKIVSDGLEDFDSALPSWIHYNFKNIRELNLSELPKRLQSLVRLAEKNTQWKSEDEKPNLLENFGVWGIESYSSWGRAMDHIGQTSAGLFRTLIGRSKVNWSDFTLQLQTSGVDALPIVALLGFLTGLIMAYVGLIQLRQVGATVYVANLVALAMTREM